MQYILFFFRDVVADEIGDEAISVSDRNTTHTDSLPLATVYDSSSQDDTVDGFVENMMNTRFSGREKPQPSEAIVDFSDPLHTFLVQKATETPLKTVLTSPEIAKSFDLPERNRMFKKYLDEVILTVSPLVRYEVPYLETELGSKCALRQFIAETFYSDLWCEYGGQDKVKKVSSDIVKEKSSPLWIGVKATHTTQHAFTTAKLCQTAKTIETQVNIIFLQYSYVIILSFKITLFLSADFIGRFSCQRWDVYSREQLQTQSFNCYC